MKKVLRVGRDVKANKMRDLDKIKAGLSGQDLDVKAELIQSLIPLALSHISEALQEEVIQLCGERHDRNRPRGNVRWTSQPGSINLADQKVPIMRPRVRNRLENREVKIPLYERLQSSANYEDMVLRKLLHGMSCRRYAESSALIPEVFGMSAGRVSKRFIRASSRKLKQFQSRRLDNYDLVALFIDGKKFQEDGLVIAMGITVKGDKVLLGFVQTGTENGNVCREFLEGLIERGLVYQQGLLCVIDGSKGLCKAITATFGSYAMIQRCQWHKRENVVGYLSKTLKAEYRRKLQAAYEQPSYEKAKRALSCIARELHDINISAKNSLKEGLEETLTLHRLGLFKQLGTSFKTANCIESIMSLVGQKTNKVDYWRNSDQKQRWMASALLDLEPRLRKVRGCKQLLLLRKAVQKELKITCPNKNVA